MKKYIFAIAAIAVFVAALVTISPSSGAQTVTLQTQKDGARKGTPTARTATWIGNGSYYEGEEFTLTDSRCEESGGAPYLYWVLTAGGRETINVATITIDGLGTYNMTRQSNGSFKYTQTFGSTPESFVDPVNVTAAYTRAKSATLVISHGCTGVVPSFTLSLGDGITSLDAGYTYLPTVDCTTGISPILFSAYSSEEHEVCYAPSNVFLYNIPANYIVTSSPEANCTYSGEALTGGKLEGTSGGDNPEGWLCTVTEEDTVITITAPPSGSPSFSLAGVLFGEATYDFDSTACTGISTDYLSLDGDLHEVCDTDPTPNVQISIPDEYTISSLPEANCQAGTPETGYILWSCTVTQANTVITITELPSFLLSVGGGIGGTISFIPSDCDTNNLESGLLSDFPLINIVCATPPAEVFNGTNVEIITDVGVTITSSPEANCVALDTQRWLCTVTQPNTVITLVAPADIGIQPPSTATSTEVRSVKR